MKKRVKKKQKVTETVAEKPIQAEPPRRYQRKKRLVEEEKTATVEEVKSVVKGDIFRKDVTEHRERDYLAKKQQTTQGVLAAYNDDGNDDSAQALVLAKNIAEAFEIDSVEPEPDEPEQEEEQDALEEEPTQPEPESEEPEPEESEKPEESESEEPKPEPEPESEYHLTQVDDGSKKDVLKCLQSVTDAYNSRSAGSDSEFCEVEYLADDVPDAKVTEDAGIQLGNYKVYVNGVLQEWDNLFEIKIPANSIIEIETGVILHVPKGFGIQIGSVPNTLEKYTLKCANKRKMLCGDDLLDPIVVTFVAGEGAYLSKIGRVIECQILQ